MIRSRQMRRLEEISESIGISRLTLMERAGKAIAEHIKGWQDLKGKSIIIFCGAGNNGGDGFAAARHIAGAAPVIVLFFGEESRLAAEAAANFARIQDDSRITILKNEEIDDAAIRRIQKKLDGQHLVLVDAMLGTGVKGKVRDPIYRGISIYNRMHGRKLAVDIPSGIDPDTGKPAGTMAVSERIITFHDLKPGLSRFHDVTVADIGIPAGAVRMLKNRHNPRKEKSRAIQWPWKTVKDLKGRKRARR